MYYQYDTPKMVYRSTLTVENAIIIQKDGKVIRFIGQVDTVSIYDVDLEGAYVTHNHPKKNDIVSFGEDDFIFLRNNQTITFSCVNEEFEYIIKVLKPIDEVVYSDLYREAIEKHSAGDELQDLAMRLLAGKGYIKYDKKRFAR